MKKIWCMLGLIMGNAVAQSGINSYVLVQFVPENARDSKVIDIKSAKLLPDDSPVTLEGYIVDYAKTLDQNEYIFSDNQETIKVEIDPDVWRNQTVNPKTKIRITGELDRNDFNQTVEVEVDYLEIIN